jgi:hypothetical protein
MPEHRLGALALTPTGDLCERLAAAVANMAPEAATVPVTAPHSVAERVTAHAHDTAGQEMGLPLASTRPIGRWIEGANPGSGCSGPGDRASSAVCGAEPVGRC